MAIKAMNFMSNDTYGLQLDQKRRLYISYGTPCSGKSTALAAWSQKYDLPLVQNPDIIDKETRLYYYLSNAFINGAKAMFFHFQMEILPMRFWQMATAPDRALVDESIYSTLAYSNALLKLNWLHEYEYRTFLNNYLSYQTILPKPKKIFFFYCKNVTVIERLKERGIPIEIESYTLEYINALNEAFLETANILREFCDIVEIDTDKYSPAEIRTSFVE